MLLKKILKERILILDGAMGSLIQHNEPKESDYRGSKLKDHPIKLKGNHELLNLHCKDLVYDIHSSYLKAGADIITTNTFNANSLSQSNYKTEHLCYDINLNASLIAVKAAKKYSTGIKPRFVAGCVGPTSKSLSMSLVSKVSEEQGLSFDKLADAYSEQISGLIDGGVDILMIETVFDTLNTKAAIYAAKKILHDRAKSIPLMISATIAGKSGRLLSGQTISAFYHSVKHANLLSIGLNCSFGPEELKPFIKDLQEEAECFISFHPNAGMPDHEGSYTQTPGQMAKNIENILQNIKINIIGGCCGTTPEHINTLSNVVTKFSPKPPNIKKHSTVLAGLEPLKTNDSNELIYVGEKTNVSGSRKFAKLIKSQNYREAVIVAEQQIEEGARILDICMDTAGVDSASAIKDFLTHLNANPHLSKHPVMIDSSDFQTIKTALKCIQGKPIVNSISLKNGEQDFINKATEIKNMGASIVVMLFDEKGQADTTKRRKEIVSRSYELLTNKAGLPAEDIIFDPNLMALGIDVNDSENQAISFLETCKYIKSNYPQTNITGGVSNLSYAFRGANQSRRAIHHVFLKKALEAGFKFAIVNPSMINNNDIPDELLKLAGDVVFEKRPAAIEHLLNYIKPESSKKTKEKKSSWREQNIKNRLKYALINGIGDYLKKDVESAIKKLDNPYKIIEEILMPAMDEISNRYDEGTLFLPQVIRSATIFQKAVEYIHPYLSSKSRNTNDSEQVVVLATVEGDVHDIGKNIGSIVFECNGFKVIDLGVMVPAQKIIETAKKNDAAMIGLSGLITPSLMEMARVAELMEKNKLKIPLLIGGATTSEKHTKENISVKYNGPVIHIKDASKIGAILKKYHENNAINNVCRK